MHKNAIVRIALLQTLYQALESDPSQVGGWMKEYDLKNSHGEVAFALLVLTELGQVKRDGNRYRITGTGVVACETHI